MSDVKVQDGDLFAEKPNRSIFAIQREYFDLANAIEDAGGEIGADQEELLIQNQLDFEKKVKSYIYIIKKKEARATLLDDEIKRLTALKKSTNKTIESFETVIVNALKLYGTQDKNGVWRYESDTFNLSTRKSNKCDIPDEAGLSYALVDKMFSVTTDEEIEALGKEVFAGHLDIAFTPTEDEPVNENVTENPEIATEISESIESTTEKEKGLNDIETDFVNNHLTYSAKLAIKFTDMVAVVKALLDKGYTKADLGIDIKIPTKDASEIVKSNKGFRIAKINTNYSLNIK